MCTQVAFKDAEGMWDYVNSVSELREHCPQIVFDEIYGSDEITEDQCLCCVDIEATAKANGFDCESRYGMDFKFSK